MSRPELRTPEVDPQNRGAVADYMAEQVCRGFRQHDRANRDAAVEAFFAVDVRQFAHLDAASARAAAEAYVDALWAKDRLEGKYTRGGSLDRAALARADWGPVEAAFRERAVHANIDPRYAERSTTAWLHHKTGRDYWTPMIRAQLFELRAALQDPEYPEKPSDGLAGPGPEAMRYALAVELHDMHTEAHWSQAKAVMRPYFERILEAHQTD